VTGRLGDGLVVCSLNIELDSGDGPPWNMFEIWNKFPNELCGFVIRLDVVVVLSLFSM